MSDLSYSSPLQAEHSAASKIDCSLLTWRDPIKTSKVFAGLLVSLILVKYVNLLSLFFRLVSYALLASGVAEFSGNLVTGRGFISRIKPKTLSTKASTKVMSCLKFIEQKFPIFEEELQKLLYAEDIEKTFKVCALTYILFKISSYFNLYRLLFGSTVLAFSIPYVYDRYHNEISERVHELLRIATVKFKDQLQVIQEKSVPYFEKAQDKLGPLSKFVHSKYQTRTASSTVDGSETELNDTPDDFKNDDVAFAISSGAQVKENAFPVSATAEIIDTPEVPSEPVPEPSGTAPEQAATAI